MRVDTVSARAFFAQLRNASLKRPAERIRGLADLEARARSCANFASKADAAGLAERTVRIAEQQGQLMVEMVQAALREVDLAPKQAWPLPEAWSDSRPRWLDKHAS